MGQDQYENLGKYFAYFYRKGRIFISKELEKYGIGSGQAAFLITLYEKDGINQEQLADLLFMDKATVARGVQKLEQNGLVKRMCCLEDKRAKIVFLTEKGKGLEGEVKKVLNTWEKKVSENLEDEEKESLKKILKKIYENPSI